MKNILFFIAIVSNLCCYSQKFDFEGEAIFTGVYASQDSIPFWFHANSNARLVDRTNASIGLGGVAKYQISENATLEAGSFIYYRDGVVTDNFQRQDFYARFKNNWLQVTAGAKSPEVLADGLSTTNKNFLWSSDARPLTGVRIEANKPLKITNNLSVDWGIAHYFLNDSRAVDNAWVHYKRLGVHWKINNKNRVYARLQHYAMWAGSSSRGKEERDFIDVFVAKQTGDRNNALGNHLGSYLLDYYWNANVGNFNFYHEHPFEDGSGTRLANFPDGVWGIHFIPNNTTVFKSFLYEYVDTTDQSGDSGTSGKDSYFNNKIYSSGWYYEGQNIGLPFLIVRINSRIRAHHVGFKLAYNKFDITVKGTYLQNQGTFFESLQYIGNSFYTYAKTSYSFEKYGSVSVLLGYDVNDITSDTFGAGIEYHIKL